MRISATIFKRSILTVFTFALFLLLSVCAVSSAEGGVQYDPLEVYRGRIHQIGFALPGIPLVLHDEDAPDYWKDSVQLNGICGLDGCEYQLHIADISPRIEAKNTENPDAEAGENEMSALLDFASFYIRYYDGTIEEIRNDPEQGLLTFRYAYPDSPGLVFYGKCYLTGSTAVCLMVEECEHNQKALSLLRPMTQDERQAFMMRMPVYQDFMGISMLFPYEPFVFTDSSGVTMAFCFAKDYTRIIAQYLPISLSMEMNDETMKQLAQRVVLTLGDEDADIQDGVLSGNEELWQYDFRFRSSLGHGNSEFFMETWRGRVFAGEDGLWYLLASDGETAEQFLKSCDLSAEAPESSYSGLWVKAEAVQAKERDPAPAPSTLRQFTRDLIALLDNGEYADIMSSEVLQIGGAIWSDGRWIRTLTVGSSDLYAILILSSDEKNAAINEIHVICEESIDDRYGDYFTACCTNAAEGITADAKPDTRSADSGIFWVGERYHADYAHDERGSVHYDRITVTANVPSEVLEPAGEWTFGLRADSGTMTVQEFCEGWDQINRTVYSNIVPITDRETVPFEDGQEMNTLMFGDSSAIMLICDADGQERISSIMVLNYEEFPPQVLLGGLLSFAVITRMPMDELIRLTLMLQEYPLWEDLYAMEPVAAWNGMALVMDDYEYQDLYVPIAYIASLSEE